MGSELSLGQDTASRTRRSVQGPRVKMPVMVTGVDPWFVKARDNGTRRASSALGSAVGESVFLGSTPWCQLSSPGWSARSSGTGERGAVDWIQSKLDPVKTGSTQNWIKSKTGSNQNWIHSKLDPVKSG